MELDTKQLWENTLTNIELSISSPSFKMWFGETHIVRIESGVVIVGVPNQLTREWLSERFGKIILKTLRDFVDTVRGVEYVVSKQEPKRTPEKVRGGADTASELPLADYYVNRSDNLNPRYTFDNFVVGTFNELAHAAAQAVVKSPGIAYNPLFVYGETGRGKTHLIQAVGNHIKKVAQKKVYYLTAERFGFEFMSAINARTIPTFKEKYRAFDLLIVDDIQFFSKKVTMQEEFFHLFNTLHDANKQIICSSDRHPNLIADITERLQGRFVAGMTVAINDPDIDSRMAIIRAKGRAIGLDLSPEVTEHISLAVPGNIREIEGILNTILCQVQLRGERSDDFIKEVIKSTAKPKRTVSVKNIISKIADFYGVEESSMYAKTRRREVVRPRQIIMYILREDFHLSYPAIGSVFGGRDHTTVIHACEKVRADLMESDDLKTQVSEIRGMLK